MVPLPFPTRRRTRSASYPPPTRAVLLNGALPGDTELDRLLNELYDALVSTGHIVQSFQLRDIPLAYCRGCFECWKKTPGVCRTKDAGPVIAKAIAQSDVLANITPITFGGYSSELKKALDRCICLVSPFSKRIHGEVRQRARYDHYPFLLTYGMLPEPDAEQERIFRLLVQRNAINLHAPGHAAEILYRGHDPQEVWGGLERLAERSAA
jgi:multimeric flavodoxin WrbA